MDKYLLLSKMVVDEYKSRFSDDCDDEDIVGYRMSVIAGGIINQNWDHVIDRYRHNKQESARKHSNQTIFEVSKKFISSVAIYMYFNNLAPEDIEEMGLEIVTLLIPGLKEVSERFKAGDIEGVKKLIQQIIERENRNYNTAGEEPEE